MVNQIDDRLKMVSAQPLLPSGRIGPAAAKKDLAKTPAAGPHSQGGGAGFDALLRAELASQKETPGQANAAGREPLKFSAHATKRLELRQIPLGPEQISKLAAAVDRAAAKGARESLVLMQDVAFIVSVPNRTVITAMSGENMKENVFTNIDSAVIAG